MLLDELPHYIDTTPPTMVRFRAAALVRDFGLERVVGAIEKLQPQQRTPVWARWLLNYKCDSALRQRIEALHAGSIQR